MSALVVAATLSAASLADCNQYEARAFYTPENCIPAMMYVSDAQGPSSETGAVLKQLGLKPASTGFQWKPALQQSFSFLMIQQGVILSTSKWARHNATHGPFIKDWFRAVKGLNGWDDGDRFLDNYIGHPLQGAITGYIQIQNDPRGRKQQFGFHSDYWKSRLKATACAAAYSTQFEIGLLSEASIQNLGGYQYRNCAQCPVTDGMGWVDIVVTPSGAFVWMVAEDAVDRFLVLPVERKIGLNHFMRAFRGMLNPARSLSNVLRGKVPWYRDSRDVGD